MKRNGAIFLLVIVAVALGVALVVRHQKAEEKEHDEAVSVDEGAARASALG